MSYDLNFYKDKNNNVTKIDLVKFLESKNIKKAKDYDTFVYQNEKTGVYFIIEDSIDKEINKEINKEIPNIQDFVDTELSLNLNFVRPDFFGRECFNIMDLFIKEFDLYVFDFETDYIYKPSKDKLYLSWSLANKNVLSQKDISKNTMYYPLEISNQDWDYNYNINNSQNELGDQYYVPKIFYMNKKNDSKVFSFTTWTENIPTLIPKVDYLFIQKETKSFIFNKKIVGIVSYNNLIENLSDYFAEYKNMVKIVDE